MIHDRGVRHVSWTVCTAKLMTHIITILKEIKTLIVPEVGKSSCKSCEILRQVIMADEDYEGQCGLKRSEMNWCRFVPDRAKDHLRLPFFISPSGNGCHRPQKVSYRSGDHATNAPQQTTNSDQRIARTSHYDPLLKIMSSTVHSIHASSLEIHQDLTAHS